MATPLTGRLTRSVLAVPPLARTGDLALNEAENTKLIRHMEAGGVRTLLYGGNANFYHISLGEYDQVLSFLAGAASRDTLVIPSAGPAYGTSIDQAKVLRRHNFPTVMVLPQQGITTAKGVEEGIRRFVQAAGVPALLYIKHDGYIEPENVKRLADAGVISGIKYAIVRADPARDEYLQKLVRLVDPKMIISGIGEQPAIAHLREFGLGAFTSGCVCVAPKLSARMLDAMRDGNWAEAERIRTIFQPLEDLRNAINPIRVLHEAVRLAGIADTGPLLPLLTNVPASDHPEIADAAKRLLLANGGNE
ncbi:MAG TPA: dihydrodipicolinate synthase family protein [Tepidisphaeraceae bacterium]